MVSYENEKKGRIPLVRDLMSVLGCMRMYMVRSPEKPNRQVIGRDEKGDEFWLPHNDALQHIYNDFHGNLLEITNIGGSLEDGKKNYTFKVVVLERVEDANWFRAIESFEMIEKEYEDLPEEYDIETLHICNCNCKCCDYCSICRGQIVWEIIG